MISRRLIALAVFSIALLTGSLVARGEGLASRLTPEPQRLELHDGVFPFRNDQVPVTVPAGPEHEACRTILEDAFRSTGVAVRITLAGPEKGNQFTLGAGGVSPPLPTSGYAKEGYTLSVRSNGVVAAAASPAGLLYAAQTLRQLVRIHAESGRLPGLTIVDYPEFKVRGIYIEGGQERFGRIVEKDYLREQIRRLAEFKMNALVIECYNLFPFASFPACADSGTLSREDCREIVAEAKRYHVTIVPSLQTLAQASELVWQCDAGKSYREPTAPGQMCPSTPEVYPFVKGLYRDLLQRFDTTPLVGVGCSEIEMQWQTRYCPRCRERISAGQTPRDLLLGHAEKCIRAVQELAAELKRPVRPLIWGDEFYMYGPGKDWVGIERIPRDTVMGYWKYWADYKGLGELLQRGYDVLGISAMYNHTFYLADLSPQSPRKAWLPMEQTGTRNIVEMVQEAAASAKGPRRAEFLGAATASFSKHRLRAFDSIWYGFALNGHCTWSHPEPKIDDYQKAFTQAFVRHYYDCRTDAAADALASAWTRLDECKSRLELANQSLHDVVGVYDTQEPGYQGNTLVGAWRKCRELLASASQSPDRLASLRKAALDVQASVCEVRQSLEAKRSSVAKPTELDDLLLAAEKISAHAEREILLLDTQAFLAKAPSLPLPQATAQAAEEAKRWSAHRMRMEAIARKDSRLYQRGDPCGHEALLRDLGAVESHLSDLAKGQTTRPAASVVLQERFETLDPTRWIVHGQPRIVAGQLETKAPGGWNNRSGIATRQAFSLETDRPLVVEFTLTPIKMGVDSQMFASDTETGADSYRFAFYGPANRFGVYTRSERELPGPWADKTAGWRLRAESAPVELNKPYRVRAEIRQASFRVVVRMPGDTAWDLPFWDSHDIPMDSLSGTHLEFADVEPEGSTASTRWGPIVIEKP